MNKLNETKNVNVPIVDDWRPDPEDILFTNSKNIM